MHDIRVKVNYLLNVMCYHITYILHGALRIFFRHMSKDPFLSNRDMSKVLKNWRICLKVLIIYDLSSCQS